MCHNADEETVVPCVFVWWDSLWHEVNNQFVEREANYWSWEDLNMEKRIPDWDEIALSNRFNAVALAVFFLDRMFVQQDKHQLNVQRMNNWPRRDLFTQPSELESNGLPLRHGVDAQRFVSDKFLNWKNSKIMANPIKRRKKNMWRPLDLKSYLFNSRSHHSDFEYDYLWMCPKLKKK